MCICAQSCGCHYYIESDEEIHVGLGGLSQEIGGKIRLLSIFFKVGILSYLKIRLHVYKIYVISQHPSDPNHSIVNATFTLLRGIGGIFISKSALPTLSLSSTILMF